MIENFVPQPYPLECSPEDGPEWLLVVGWCRLPDGRLSPVVTAPPSGPLTAATQNLSALRYRLADTRPAAVAPARTSAPTMRARGSHGAA